MLSTEGAKRVMSRNYGNAVLGWGCLLLVLCGVWLLSVEVLNSAVIIEYITVLMYRVMTVVGSHYNAEIWWNNNL